MPFAYYGAKHALSRKYPPPVGKHIIEPFAGSAAYSVRWAAYVDCVTLYEIDAAVVELWERVKLLTSDDMRALDYHAANDQITSDPLIAASAGSESLRAALHGKLRTITPRMRDAWRTFVSQRIENSLPHLHKFTIHHGSYSDAPDVEATWFIDPPYMAIINDHCQTSGNAYRHGAKNIDYQHLAEWCRSRRGFVMVCEQSPASWLPFSPFASQVNGSHTPSSRMEVLWRNDCEQRPLFD